MQLKCPVAMFIILTVLHLMEMVLKSNKFIKKYYCSDRSHIKINVFQSYGGSYWTKPMNQCLSIFSCW